MRTFTTTLLFLAIISSGAFSQIPDGINYQAVALDAAGNKIVGTDASWNILADKQFNVRFSIHETTPDGTVLYQEAHLANTDPFGMFSLVIGHGDNTGGLFEKLSDIPWGRDKVFLRVEIDIARDQNYKLMDIQQMMAVPFAFHAGSAGAMSVIKAAEDHDPDKPIFAVTNSKGDTVFAVFETGVIIGIDPDAPKGSRGGFAVGGFSSRKGGEITEYFRVDPGFVQVTIDDDPETKGSRGGFAVGGFSSVKGLQADYFHLTPGSAEFQMDKDYIFPDSKGSRGGFAVGGFSSVKGGIPTEYLRVTSDSVRVYIDETDDENKGSRGGFAVGGFSSVKGDGIEYLRVDPGFIRLTIDDDPLKGSRGGFAVGGFSSARTKGAPDYLNLTPGGASFLSDMDYPVDLKGTRGGFAVGGFSSKKSTGVNDYLSLTAASSRVYIYDDPEGGLGGSFAVVERSGKKGDDYDVLYVAPDRTSVYLKENRKNSPDGFSVFNREGDHVDRLFSVSEQGTFVATLFAVAPLVSTHAALSITSISAIAGGRLEKDGGSDVTEMGIIYVDASDPSLTRITVKAQESDIVDGVFTVILENLIPGTKYLIRAYSVNSAGIGYGQQEVFETLP